MKVVEHLCTIQSLEESGYDPLEAEAALHLHDYNQDEVSNTDSVFLIYS